MRPLTAEQREHIEETRAYRFSGDRYPDRVNERSRLHTALLRHTTQDRFERGRIERGRASERRVDRAQVLVHILDAQMLRDRCLVVVERVGQQEPADGYELVELLRSRFQEL